MGNSLKVVLRVTDRCNQDCVYCYVDRATRRTSRVVLDLALLENFYAQFLTGAYRHVHFVFHGGEPTLVGEEYLRRALDLQGQYVASGVEVENSIQTNATAMNERIARLLCEQGVGVGISLDAPPDVHDRLRVDWRGRSTYERVLANVQMMREAGLRFGAICVLHRLNYQRTEEIYRFFKELGLNYQFNPLYKDEATPCAIAAELAISPEQYADALIHTFDLFVRDANPTIEISDLKEIILSMCVGRSRSCLFAGNCEEYIGVLPNGDVSFCDVFFKDDYRIGNLSTLTPKNLRESGVLRQIASRPERLLATACGYCPWWGICHGGCTSKAIALFGDPFREDPYCETRKRLFAHIHGTLDRMAGKEVRGVAENEADGARSVRCS